MRSDEWRSGGAAGVSEVAGAVMIVCYILKSRRHHEAETRYAGKREGCCTTPCRANYAAEVADLVTLRVVAVIHLRGSTTEVFFQRSTDQPLFYTYFHSLHTHDMAKKEQKRAVVEDTANPSESSQSMTTLDPAEIMKAMMAARKGKGHEESEDGSDASESEDEDREAEGIEEIDSGSENSEPSLASSSTSPPRGVKRSRSTSKSPVRTTPPSRTAEATSRVKSASQPATKSKQSSTNPFDTPKAAAHATFASLGLSQPLINALAGINIQKPTEIQSACVGPIMDGKSPK